MERARNQAIDGVCFVGDDTDQDAGRRNASVETTRRRVLTAFGRRVGAITRAVLPVIDKTLHDAGVRQRRRMAKIEEAFSARRCRRMRRRRSFLTASSADPGPTASGPGLR